MSFAFKSVLLILFLFAYIVFAYFINLREFLSDAPGFKNFLVSFVYALVWLLVLYFGVKNNSSALLVFYMIFWGLAIVYFGLHPYVIDTALGTLWFFGSIVFLIPALGVLYPLTILREAVKADSLYDLRAEMIWLALFALVLFAVGFVAWNRLGRLS